MQKVYRLLRNNQQTGPFNLDEIIQLGLKPFDLIWVEGRSGGWSYPSEIDTLKPYLPQSQDKEHFTYKRDTSSTFSSTPEKKAPSKKVFISMPVQAQNITANKDSDRLKSIEQKAEELRQRAQAYMPKAEGPHDEGDLRTNYTRSLNDVEEDYTNWVYKKKVNKPFLSSKKILSAAMAVAILALSVYGIKAFLIDDTNNKPQQLTVKNTAAPQQQEIKNEANLQADYINEPAEEKIIRHNKQEVDIKDKNITTTPVKTSNDIIYDDANNEVVVETVDPPAQQEEPLTTETTTEKKKTFKETISNIFKKKSKDETSKEGAENTTNGERKARKRTEQTIENTSPISTSEIVNIINEVEVKTSKPENWMMGIKDLKITLHNKSSINLKNASVEILYYSEQNNLIDKKIIRFSNITAGKSKTISAPDHRLANNAEAKVIEATGVQIAYAKN